MKRFCTEDGAITVFDKARNSIFSTGLDSVAVEKNFYTVDGLEDPYCWEKAYAEIVEPMMNDLLTKIISRVNALVQTGHRIITENEKNQLAFIMMMQLLRGKQSRAYEKKLFDELMPYAIEKAKEKFGALTNNQQEILNIFATNPRYFKQISMGLAWDIKRINRYIDILAWHDFVFYHICGDMEFVTSDNPVMFINCSTANAQPFANGLAHETTLIYYPLSPKLLLCAVHPNAYFQVFSNKDGCLYHLNTYKEESFINTINHKQCSQCHNQVFALTKKTLEKINQ